MPKMPDAACVAISSQAGRRDAVGKIFQATGMFPPGAMLSHTGNDRALKRTTQDLCHIVFTLSSLMTGGEDGPPGCLAAMS